MSGNRVFIIAEAGINHNGNVKLAKRMINIAAASGADAVKFQTFIPEEVISIHAEKAPYQKERMPDGGSQLEMVRKYRFSEMEHILLKGYCAKKRILFLSSPFDIKSIELLHRLGMSIMKIPSGEITNLPYLEKIGSLNKKLILSSGMSSLDEIGDAIKILVNSGTDRSKITVLHCNTAYPTPFSDVNLRAMLSIKNRFNINVGYSDHTLGIEITIAAVALGAVVIEKHFTLSREMKGPDHKASLEPFELEAMVSAIRNTEISLGDGIKRPSRSERKNLLIARKSIVASEKISKGEILSYKNITAKRPGNGISPMLIKKVIGTRAYKNYEKDDFIKLNKK